MVGDVKPKPRRIKSNKDKEVLDFGDNSDDNSVSGGESSNSQDEDEDDDQIARMKARIRQIKPM